MSRPRCGFRGCLWLCAPFPHESNTYGELETGETTLAFAASELADLHFEGGVIPAAASARPLGVEIAFVTQDVAGAHVRAVNAGATQLSAPETKGPGRVLCPMPGRIAGRTVQPDPGMTGRIRGSQARRSSR